MRLCVLDIHITLFFANWPKVSRQVNRPDSWLLEMESSLPRHFGIVNYNLTKKVSQCGVLKDFNITDQQTKKGQLSVTKKKKKGKSNILTHTERKYLPQVYWQQQKGLFSVFFFSLISINDIVRKSPLYNTIHSAFVEHYCAQGTLLCKG